MNAYSHIPLVRMVIPVILGIIVFSNIKQEIPLFTFIGVLGLMGAMLFVVQKYVLALYELRWVYGLLVMLTLGFSSYILAQNHYQIWHTQHFSKHTSENTSLRLILIEPISEKSNSYQLICKATHIWKNDTVLSTKGKLMLYLEKDSLVSQLQYGDVLIIHGTHQAVPPKRNPNAFDYAGFLANLNIFHQAYRQSGDWYFTGNNEGKWVIRHSHRMREVALRSLEENHIHNREFSVVSALLLGFRDYLDEDLRREFAGAGAMHILCVSGLHVGIIFLALNFAFGFVKRFKYGIFIHTGIIIVLIWFYAAITGFSPSVMRASTMFSLVALARAVQRDTNIYNTLAASALILIVIDPFIINRIGFQLSYIAVISIVSMQPVMYKKLYFKNPLLDKAWGIITVSIAAQLGTGPLALYYFNQFPNYFLLTNLLVIPLAGVIINLGLIFFVSSPIPILSDLLGKLLSAIVWVLHSGVRLIEGLPGSTFQNVYLNMPQTLTIFAFLTFMTILFYKTEKKILYALLAFGLVFSFQTSQNLLSQQSGAQMAIYHVPRGTAIDFISGNQCYFVACANTLSNERNIQFNIAENRIKQGVARKQNQKWFVLDSAEHIQTPNLYYDASFLQFKDKKIKILDSSENLNSLAFKDTLDYLIIRNNPRTSLGKISQSYPAKKIVLDNSNSFRNINRWLEECDSLGFQCWAISQQGAYVVNF